MNRKKTQSQREARKRVVLRLQIASLFMVCGLLAAQPLAGESATNIERRDSEDPVSPGSPISGTAAGPSRPKETVGLIAAQESYRIGPGDVLQVSVWREPEVSVEAVVVRSDGKISMPLIKELEASGLTPRDFESLLTEVLARFIKDPDVTVIVREIHSQKIHVVGGVREPGTLPLQGPTTVLQALAQAGGPTEFAKKSKIYVLRRQRERTERLPFDYKAIMNGKNSDENILLRSGDTVVVPE